MSELKKILIIAGILGTFLVLIDNSVILHTRLSFYNDLEYRVRKFPYHFFESIIVVLISLGIIWGGITYSLVQEYTRLNEQQ